MIKAKLTAIKVEASECGFWAVCPEVEGANGQDETVEEARLNLQQAI